MVEDDESAKLSSLQWCDKDESCCLRCINSSSSSQEMSPVQSPVSEPLLLLNVKYPGESDRLLSFVNGEDNFSRVLIFPYT